VFEILEHTADVGFRARGDSIGDLFANAALALEAIAADISGVEEKAMRPLSAAGEGLDELLVNWLNEVLYYLDGERFVMKRFEIDELVPSRVSGRGWGEPRDDGRHPPRLVVKGVTYHLLEVRRDGGLWHARVILDI